MATLKTKILHRNDTTTNWESSNPTLAKGEFGIEWVTNGSATVEGACRVKVGDGYTKWNDLNYFGGDAIKISTTGSGNSVVSVTSSTDDLGVTTYTLGLGNRLTGSNLTADQILLGNGGVAVKSSGKTITTSITGSANVPTDKAVKDYVDGAIDGISAGDLGAVTSVSVGDDGIVNLSVTNSGTTVTVTGTHATKGPSNGYTSQNATTSISGSGATGTIKVPQITVDKYGHVTAAADEDVTITMPTIPNVTTDATGTGNVITSLTSSGHKVTAVKGLSVYTKDEVNDLISESGVKSVTASDDGIIISSVTTNAGAVSISLSHKKGGSTVKDSYGMDSKGDNKVSIGGTLDIKVPYIAFDEYGHIVEASSENNTLSIDLSDTYTKTQIDDKIAEQVASAVQYLGTVSAVANLGKDITVGKGDFYRASADVANTWHAGDIIIAEKDNPTAAVDGTNWSVIHGEEVGVESIAAADNSVVIAGTASNPTIKVNTGYSTTGKSYAVKSATSGLYVDVPWENDNTTYSPGTGLSLSGTTFNHSNAVTAVTSASLLKVKYDAQGHISGSAAVTKADITALGIPGQDSQDPGYGKITISNGTATPNSTTDASLTADIYNAGITFKGANEWVVVKGLNGPTSGNDLVEWSHKLSSLTAGTYGPKEDVTGNDNSTIVIPQITTDAAGHITGITNRTLTLKNTDTDTWRNIKVGSVTSGTSSSGVPLQLQAAAGLSVTAAAGSSFLVTYSLDISTLDGGSAADSGWGTVS